jgi:hypothetical protein
MLGSMQTDRCIKFFNISILLALMFSPCVFAQLISTSKQSPLEVYRDCSFRDGLQVIEVDSLAPGVTERSIDTTQGSKTIEMLAGNRIGFAYPGTDIFANVKAEQLPPVSWNEQKELLHQNFAYLLGSSPDFRSDRISGRDLLNLHSEGMTKTSVSGGVLAFYLLFDDSRHVVATIYLVNQEPSSRKFQTLEEFRTLESRFLDTYAACIANRASDQR